MEAILKELVDTNPNVRKNAMYKLSNFNRK